MAEFALNDTLRLLQQLPEEARTWIRAAHRSALTEFRDRKDYPGVACRFDQKSNERSSIGRTFLAISNKGPYDFATRGYALRGRRLNDSTKANVAQRMVQRNFGTPPYVYGGTMRNELLRRKPKTAFSGTDVKTTLSLNHRALNMFGGKRGVTRKEKTTRPITYLMTVYHDSVNRTGARKVQVTRNISQFRMVFASTTYGQEWQLRGQETAWIQRRSDGLLTQIVRSAIYTKTGRLRAPFKDRLGVPS